MAFWEGVKKIFSGIEEIASAPGELLVEMRYKRRVALSGKYTVRIPAEYEGAALVARISFNGGANMHDIDLLTYDGGSADVWDDLSDSTKLRVNSKIRSFLSDLMVKHRANPHQ